MINRLHTYSEWHSLALTVLIFSGADRDDGFKERQALCL